MPCPALERVAFVITIRGGAGEAVERHPRAPPEKCSWWWLNTASLRVILGASRSEVRNGLTVGGGHNPTRVR
jgi:hypothetical protein